MKHIAKASTRSFIDSFKTEDVQPNALDVRLDKVFAIGDEAFIIDEEQKVHRSTTTIEPNVDGYYVLKPGVYSIVMEGTITVGDDESGWIITRSTLNRNGVHITTGLYDSGYSGKMVATLHVNCGNMKIKKGTRVGQFLVFDSEALHGYNGDYGTGTEHDKKYGD